MRTSANLYQPIQHTNQKSIFKYQAQAERPRAYMLLVLKILNLSIDLNSFTCKVRFVQQVALEHVEKSLTDRQYSIKYQRRVITYMLIRNLCDFQKLHTHKYNYMVRGNVTARIICDQGILTREHFQQFHTVLYGNVKYTSSSKYDHLPEPCLRKRSKFHP